MDSQIAKRMRATLIIEAVRQRGNDAGDLRDAAHEAAHVFQLEPSFAEQWQRPIIHDALTRRVRKRSGGVLNPMTILTAYEYQARAVEMLVCRELAVDYDLLEFANTMLLETAMLLGHLRDDIDADGARERILASAARRETTAIVKRVLALGER